VPQIRDLCHKGFHFVATDEALADIDVIVSQLCNAEDIPEDHSSIEVDLFLVCGEEDWDHFQGITKLFRFEVVNQGPGDKALICFCNSETF
jgi:hypothetical protein